MSSFIAAGTAYASHGVNTIPFFVFYSMFGMQRVGDLVWAAGDMRCKGFLIGATSGKTTLAGEGLQHQDGHSHLLAYPHPTVMAYDPAYAYELAVIIREGIRRMYVEREDLFYYLTVGNEPYTMPEMPSPRLETEEGILKGIYLLRKGDPAKQPIKIQLLGSGSILKEVIRASEILEEEYGFSADVWSVTSYKELYKDALETARWNRLHEPEQRREPFIRRTLGTTGVAVAASDNTAALPVSVARWAPRHFVTLGTDGFGRSGSRSALRDHFEVDHRYVVVSTLVSLHKEGIVDKEKVSAAIRKYGIDPEKANPLTA